MSPVRYEPRDTDFGKILTVAAGAIAGFALGVFVAQRYDRIAGASSRIGKAVSRRIERRKARRGGPGVPDLSHLMDEPLGEAEPAEDDAILTLEERVLEVFRNDPILADRPIDISVVEGGVVELDGWVREMPEVAHAATLAGGIPGVARVHNFLDVAEPGDDDAPLGDSTDPPGGQRRRLRDASRRDASRAD